ncbi:ABC transporter ATP-binding protein [Pseudonocardia sp. NPDC049635]|uniref:ABC transporter ATP-binding protein n=1 Tax=Pseudonocardia sp. NPDC049635 TaxID=3155506 RepID=UPI0033EBBFDF
MTTPGTAQLEVIGLTVRYSGQVDAPAVDDVTFSIAPGELVALVGESGSGKTTLGMAVGGFSDPAATVTGELRLAGRSIPPPAATLLPYRRAGVSMVFQDPMSSLDVVWTVRSQFSAVLRGTGVTDRAEIRARTAQWLLKVGLTDPDRVMASRPYELSGGMRQRVMIALALCSAPALVVADEPTGSLDAENSRAAMASFIDLARDSGTSLLMISHDIRLCREYADRILVMHRGKVVEQLAANAVDDAVHPYTRALLRCVPTMANFTVRRLPTVDSFLGTGELVDG